MNTNAINTFAASHEDIKLAIRAVKDKMEVQFAKSMDYKLIDLANQTVNQGDQLPQADYKPLAFIPSMQIKIPFFGIIIWNLEISTPYFPKF